jgi:hypothetical protein
LAFWPPVAALTKQMGLSRIAVIEEPAMPEFKVTRVYETKFPIAHMPRPDLGQIDFSVEGETISFLLPRGDFERLGRKIARLVAEIPPPSKQVSVD